MNRLFGLVKYLLTNFGPLIAFYGVNRFFGLKTALVCSLAVTIVEVLNLKLRKREKLSSFFKFSVAVTLIFGMLDLLLAKAVFIRYEAALMNFIFGAYFTITAFGEAPIMIEFARKSGKFQHNMTPAFVAFFRYLTFFWVIYFLAKASFYFWVAYQDLSLAELLLVRTVVGNGSLAAMILLSTLGGRPLYKLLFRLGLLGSAPKEQTQPN